MGEAARILLEGDSADVLAGGATDPIDAVETLLKRFGRSGANFHLDGSSDWSVSAETLRFLARHVSPGTRTLETGAGLSTVAFAMLGAHHICVCPDSGEIERITRFCQTQGIDLGQVTFETSLSEDLLPKLEGPALDFVLIDGGHGFPMPVIDWYFAARHMKVGGVLVIDDTHLWSCGMLVDFLKHDPAWSRLGRIGRRTFAFRLEAAFAYLEFCFQPYVVSKSRVPSLVSRALVAWDLLVSGDFTEFGRRLRRPAQ